MGPWMETEYKNTKKLQVRVVFQILTCMYLTIAQPNLPLMEMHSGYLTGLNWDWMMVMYLVSSLVMS